MKTVLVVEDDRSLIRLIELNLQAEGYYPVLCGTGEIALSTLESLVPDLMLLDLKLPGPASGWDVLSHVRSDHRLRRLPVIVVSAYAHAQDMAQARALGAGDYLVKPFGVLDLLARVERLIGRPEAAP